MFYFQLFVKPLNQLILLVLCLFTMFHKYKCWQDRCVTLNRDSFLRLSITTGGGHVLFKKWCDLDSLSASSLSLPCMLYCFSLFTHTQTRNEMCFQLYDFVVMWLAPESLFCYFQGIFVSNVHTSLVKVTVKVPTI